MAPRFKKRRLSKSRRVYKKKGQIKGSMSGKIRKLEKDLKLTSRLAEADTGTHIYRTRNTETLKCLTNLTIINGYPINNNSIIDLALGSLSFYDPADGTNLDTAVDGALGTFQRDLYFEYVKSSVRFRNNCNIPLNLSAYICLPRENTDLSAFSAFSEGMLDQGNPALTFPTMEITDSVLFKKLWRIVKQKKVFLEPGEVCMMDVKSKSFRYDPSYFDSLNGKGGKYVPMYYPYELMVQVTGPVSVDTNLDTEIGTSEASIDFLCDVEFKLKYAAGTDIFTIGVLDLSNSMTATPVVSNKPAVDSQQFSAV